ncbi:NOP5/NOP56 family protein [Halocatena pleomorpha]|uniref:NOP58 family protein n=1 Tax=Halocatena pleomorpha TaxID=1785090 RepID=A0A3P3R6D1_9EURY|nr:NOP5/NOP56 family protein [Halocatena pleomorpha]RRJ29032.1 NOP58 family protein [Halocatena pleomorpha]
MNEDAVSDSGWFRGVDPGDGSSARHAIEHGSAESPAAWPDHAVESGFVDNRSQYYEVLHDVTTAVARTQVREREGTDVQRIIHCVRAMDDVERVANELAERVSAWAGASFDDPGTGIEYAREIADETAADSEDRRGALDARLSSLAAQVRALDDEGQALRDTIERVTPEVAPNVSMLAGPVLAARLIALAGGLETLAKKPSGTVQLLGAEDALFAHLSGRASSPKHGIIYVHEYVSGTAPEHRGTAARALAGKLTIAARIDHYSGDRRPELQAELDERIARIRERGD